MFGSRSRSLVTHGAKTRLDGGRPERRHCSILRVEFAHLPETADSLEAGELEVRMAALLELLTEPILNYEGAVLSHRQAGVVAIWNAPHEQPNHALLALAAARAAMAAASAGRRAFGLRPRGGVVTGDVVVANFGSRARKAYAPIGSLVTSSDIACSGAPEGVLRISRATLAEAGEAMAFEGDYAEERF